MKEFTDILDKYPGGRGMDMLLHIFYCCELSNDNPYVNVDFLIKEKSSAARVFGKGNVFTQEEIADIHTGFNTYNFFNETAVERGGNTFDDKIDEIRSLLAKTKPVIHTVFDADGAIEKFVSNDKILDSFAAQINKYATYKLAAIKTASQIQGAGRIRGGKSSSAIEAGLFNEEDDE
jgi:hypothetical protein